jgi:hypothetical protein
VEAFCLTPVIACLFFVAGVLSMLEMQVSDVFCCRKVIPYLHDVNLTKTKNDWNKTEIKKLNTCQF